MTKNKVFTKLSLTLICVLTLLLAGVMPFFVNYTVNAAHYDPTQDSQGAALAELLTLSLYPEIYSLQLIARKPSGMNFGVYNVSVLYNFHSDGGGGERGQKYSVLGLDTVINKKNLHTSHFNAININYKIEKSLFENADAAPQWQKITDDGKYYYGYFALTAPCAAGLSGDVGIYNKYTTSTGQKLTEWIACSIEGDNRVWGLTSPARTAVFYTHFGANYSLSSVFDACAAYTEAIKYLSQLELFGNLSGIDFAALSAQAKNAQIIGLMMYGTGAQLKDFLHNSELRLVKIS